MKPMHVLLLMILLLVVFSVSGAAKASQQHNANISQQWPLELEVDGQIVKVYHPQIDEYEESAVVGRSAFSVRITSVGAQSSNQPSNQSMVFGAMSFRASMVTNADASLALSDFVIDGFKLPQDMANNQAEFQQRLLTKVNARAVNIIDDRIIAEGDSSTSYLTKFNHSAPDIYYADEPTVLVLIDGEPILEKTDFEDVSKVVNSAFYIAYDRPTQTYYLRGGHWWYASKSADKDWQSIDYPPLAIEQMAEQEFVEDKEEDIAVAQLTVAPNIIVSTEPAELIVSLGQPVFTAIADSSLLYLDNSENDVFMEIDSQQYFVLIAGRWYRSAKIASNSWEFIEPDQLPDSFFTIPEKSEVAAVLSNVAGTAQAKEALLENAIPQTAEVSRSDAEFHVEYDGEPEFELIEGTDVAYALNTDSTVLAINQRYYAVDDGVWFESDNAFDDWQVSVSVPTEVNDIPPSSPVYPVRYVQIYEVTPDAVYTGYTPGYFGSYVYRNTVIYGTGYRYRPWAAVRYYPRPTTYGYGVHYHPYTGWGYPTGLSYRWLTFQPRYWRYWGYAGYRYGYRHGYYHRYRHSYYQGHRNGYRYGFGAGRYAGYRANYNYNNGSMVQSSNLYRHRSTGVNKTELARQDLQHRALAASTTSQRTVASNRDARLRSYTLPRNQHQKRSGNTVARTRERITVATDRQGNSYRRDNEGRWQPQVRTLKRTERTQSSKRNDSSRSETFDARRSQDRKPSTLHNSEQRNNRSRYELEPRVSDKKSSRYNYGQRKQSSTQNNATFNRSSTNNSAERNNATRTLQQNKPPSRQPTKSFKPQSRTKTYKPPTRNNSSKAKTNRSTNSSRKSTKSTRSSRIH